MTRTILHSDLNAFYASVECMANPDLRSSPVAVCGDPEARHGIILAKNELAKAYGIKTGEAIWQAKQKCPQLVTVAAHFSDYLKVSQLVRDIYYDYTDRIEAFGIDECWLDVGGSVRLFGSGESIANEIRQRIKRELGITVSIGVSFNKVFAKLGSDMRKPDATTVISKENFKRTVWCLPVSDLLYVGRATTKKLYRMNVRTIGELAQLDCKYLYHVFGKWGIVLSRFANGVDYSPVAVNNAESCIKSVGNSITAPRDMTTIDDVKAIIYMLSDSVAARLRSHGLKCTNVQIYVRDNKLVSYERQGKTRFPTYITREISDLSMKLFMQKYVAEIENSVDGRFVKPLRSVGVRGSDLVPEKQTQQLDIFTDIQKRDKLESIEHTIDGIRSRYGYHVIKNGILFEDADLTRVSPKDDHTIHPVGYFDGKLEV